MRDCPVCQGQGVDLPELGHTCPHCGAVRRRGVTVTVYPEPARCPHCRRTLAAGQQPDQPCRWCEQGGR